jgi:hypothetical protein
MESSILQAIPGQQSIAKWPQFAPAAAEFGDVLWIGECHFRNEAALVSSDSRVSSGVLFEMSTLLGFRQYQRHHNRKTTTPPDFALHANGAAL